MKCSQSIISLSENKRTYQLENKSHRCIHSYRIDNGIITSQNVSKCDYAIFIDTNYLILIELKGVDISHAIDQIENTINTLIRNNGVSVNRIDARIVISRGPNPKIIASKQQRLEKLLLKYHGHLNYREKKLLESI